MRLSFDEYGKIITNDGSLYASLNHESELNRLNMFFGVLKGAYPYERTFGNTSFDIFGKIYIDDLDLTMFDTKVSNDLAASGIFNSPSVTTNQIDPRFLETTVSLGGEDIVWSFNTYKGRLTKVTKTEPEIEEFNHIISVMYFKGTGRLSYNVEAAYNRCDEENGIELESDTAYMHRLFECTSQIEQTGTPILNYTLNDFDKNLKLNNAVSEDKWIRMEIWPADRANLVAETNPYLLRK